MKKLTNILIISVVLLVIGHQSSFAAQESIRINFFSEQLIVNYDPQMKKSMPPTASQVAYERFYYELSNTQYYNLVGNLLHHKSKLQLNDWLYFRLVVRTVEEIFKEENDNYRTLVCWFLLHKSGYQVQINFVDNQVALSVFTTDRLYEMPVKRHKHGWFVDITPSYSKAKLTSMRPDFQIDGGGKPFSFKLEKLPVFSNPKLINRQLAFVHNNTLHKINVQLNKSLLQLMVQYPEMSVKEHVNVRLSPTAYVSLVPELKRMIHGKSDEQAISFLLSFTRQAMRYKTDKSAWQINNITFTPEETLFYKYSDCEDRSVLFSYLVRELLGLDVVLVDFPGHASTAVLLDKPAGKPIVYKGRKYTLCDPTGPGDHLKLGDYPKGLADKPYKIIEK